MHAPAHPKRTLALLTLIAASLAAPGAAQKVKDAAATPSGPAIFRGHADISKLNLRNGPGSPRRAPSAPFAFVAEDADGSSPKITVRDARGVVWSVKTGVEAQPETVATRLLWALGYFAEDSYYLERATVRDLPKSLSRGREFVRRGALVGARFEPRRANVARGARWDWEENPFAGTRDFNGLKVLMVLLGNYDARPENNQIFTVRDERTGRLETRYYVSDVGATLGRVGGIGSRRSKNSLADFRASRFVEGVENGVVSFEYRVRPRGAGPFLSMFGAGYDESQAKKERAMRRVPVEDARWLGRRLSQLSDEQLRDAFRAADYDAATREGFVRAIRRRARLLAGLTDGRVASAQATPTKED